MNEAASKVLCWAPRVLCLLFAAFISIFAADAFTGAHGFWDTALRVSIHLIPTAVILAILAVSWRREWVGGVLFTTLGVLYSVMFWGRFHWSAYAAISGPLLLMGLLFSSNWWRSLRQARGPRYRGRMEPQCGDWGYAFTCLLSASRAAGRLLERGVQAGQVAPLVWMAAAAAAAASGA